MKTPRSFPVDSGTVKEGIFADRVIFDPATVTDNATFEKPHQTSTGVRDVFVNGGAVWRNGKLTGATPERALPGLATQGAKGAKGA